LAIAIGLLKTLLELASSRKSGAVDASAHSARVRVFVEDGDIVFAEEGGVGETLGRILVRERVLNEDQYAAAIEWTADLRARGEKARLGEVMVELGFLTPEQLNAALSAQVRHKVVRAIGWAGAQVSFMECHGMLSVAAHHSTPLEPLVLAALRVAERARVDELFDQARSRFVGLRADRAARAQTLERLTSFRMHDDEDAFARGLDGAWTIDELLEVEEGGVDRAVVLAALLLTDCLDLHGTPQSGRDKPLARPKPPRPRKSGTSLAPVPVSQAPSSLARVPQALLEKPAQVAKTRAVAVVAMTTRQRARVKRLAARLRAMRAAQRALAAARTNATALEIPTTARLLAEKAFQAGKKLARANRMAHARDELRRACSLFSAPEYEVWAAWASLRSEPRHAHAYAEELREAAERAVAQNPELGFGFYALAHLARGAGDEARAKELFARARSLDAEGIESALDIRFRYVVPASPSETKGELRPLARLLTAPAPAAVRAKAVREREEAEKRERERALERERAQEREREAREKTEKRESERALERARSDARESEGAQKREREAREKSEKEQRDKAEKHESERALERERALEQERDNGEKRERAEEQERAQAREAARERQRENEERWTRDPTRDATTVRPPPPKPDPRVDRARAKARARSQQTVLVAIAALVLLAVVVARSTPGSRPPTATADSTTAAPPPPPASSPSLLSSAAVEETPEVADAAIEVLELEDAAPASDAGADVAVPPAAEESDIPKTVALLDLPKLANGHRVFVDGRVVGEPPAVVFAPCGRHVVKVGSTGRDQLLDVPCGARLSVAYP
jgi:hypothetical protein